LITALGPILFALARGELKQLWSFSDAPAEDGKDKPTAKLDETIEAPSEAAMKARQVVDDTVQEAGEQVEAVVNEVEDDSWMDGSVGGTNGTDGKARKRKGGKKK
jgi:hypothetical protein